MINVSVTNIENVSVDNEWNFSDDSEFLMHSIHAYPAKFPAFMASKAFDYANSENVNVEKVADIFCGCGTVALEAKLHGKHFWGCDINPVATLIAKTKSKDYKEDVLYKYYTQILNFSQQVTVPSQAYIKSNERLQYWFSENNYILLYKLYESILSNVPNGKYRSAFLCLFSSILKSSSKWLTKSIKPQVDPNKNEADVFFVFSAQFQKFKRAVEQISNSQKTMSRIVINNKNFLKVHDCPKVDLIISSPPYVTSYEYADLHQLSALWLGYAEDYRDLRKGSIGSLYNSEDFSVELDSLNDIGRRIVIDLKADRKPTAQVRSVARYYLDMQKAIRQCSKMLNDEGMIFFVVGDTEYKGVKIKNSEHLVQCLLEEGFSDIKAAKRRISNKLLTPYRDNIGRFSSDKTQRTIYHEEYVISGRMCQK